MKNSTYSLKSPQPVDYSVFNFSSLSIVAIGLVGNVCMFKIFSSKPLSKLSISSYFQVLSLIKLFININWIKKFFGFEYNFNITNQSAFLCKSATYVIYTVCTSATWILASAGLDRYLIIAYPTRFQFILKAHFPFYVIITVTVYNMISYVYMLVDTNLIITINSSTNETSFECRLGKNSFFNIFDFLNVAIIPFLIMSFSTIGIFFVVYKSRSRMRRFEQASRTNQKRMRDLKFGVSMIFTNTVFVTLCAPTCIYEYFFSQESVFEPRLIFSAMFYLFYSITFYLQLAVNNLVRKQFFSMLARQMSKFKRFKT